MADFGVLITNGFALLDENENEDPQQLANTVPAKAAKPVAAKKEAAKVEVKAAAPAKEQHGHSEHGGRPESGRGRGDGRGRGRGPPRGGRGRGEPRPNGDRIAEVNAEEGNGVPIERSERPRGEHHGRGGGRGGRGYGGGYDGSRPPRREYDRHDGTGRGHEGAKKGGAGKGNWGKAEEDGNNVEAEPKAEVAAEDGAAAPEVVDVNVPEAANEESAPVEEEEKPAPELSLEEYEQLVAQKKAALNKTREVASVDMSEFAGMKTLKKVEEPVGLELSTKKEKAAEKSKAKKEVIKLEANFKVGAEEATRGPRGGRGGRGGRGPPGDGSPRPASARGGRGRGDGTGRRPPAQAAEPAIDVSEDSFPSLA